MGEADRTVWDDRKNDLNIQRRGLDFTDLDAVFDGRFAITRRDARRDYGEPRFNMVVALDEIMLNITFTLRDRKYRIISARLASRKERRAYHAARQDIEVR